jgi:hypothetical protein
VEGGLVTYLQTEVTEHGPYDLVPEGLQLTAQRLGRCKFCLFEPSSISLLRCILRCNITPTCSRGAASERQACQVFVVQVEWEDHVPISQGCSQN